MTEALRCGMLPAPAANGRRSRDVVTCGMASGHHSHGWGGMGAVTGVRAAAHGGGAVAEHVWSFSTCANLKATPLKAFQHQNHRRGKFPCRRSKSRIATALFTGIVEEMGKVTEVRRVQETGGFEMTVEADLVLEDVKLGDSISVNGTCLTVTAFTSQSFCVGLAPETLRKTSLGEAPAGARVNLERSLQPSSRMGGHFVQGHVDGTGTILSLEPEGDSLWVKVKTTPEILRYIVPKGYIAVDGTSLTVVTVLDEESAFTFMLVAYTQQKIVIPQKMVGQKVNLEVDIVGKYVEKMLHGYKTPEALLEV